MLFVGHLTLGVLAFLLVQPYLIGNQVLLFLTVLLGSLLPDIDEGNSKICKWSGPLGRLVAKTFPHRGFIHSLLFFSILYFTIDYFVNRYYATALIIGYFAHITGDGISLSGLRIFYPLRFKIKGPLRVGSTLEHIIVACLLVWIVHLL